MPIIIRGDAPNFKLNGAQGKDVITNISLDTYRGKWVVLLFYPMDWTFVCPTEIISYNDAMEEFSALNTVVLPISGDSPYTHLSWLQAPRGEGGLGNLVSLPLLSDTDRSVMKDYGVYNDVDASGLDYTMAFRGLFLIDPKRKIRHVLINDNSVGRNVRETLRTIKRMQYTDKHGEVCAAAGDEEDMTLLKPTPAGISKFLVNLKKD